jgi:hypothetical protein
MNCELFQCDKCFRLRSQVDWDRPFVGKTNPYVPCPTCGSTKLRNAPVTRWNIACFLAARPRLWGTFVKENIVGAIRG